MRVNDAFGAVAALAASQHGAFNRRQAAEAGLHPNQLRRLEDAGRIIRRAPGAFVVAGSPDTWLLQLSVATLAGRERAVVAARSAAALHRLDGSVQGPVDVQVPRATNLAVAGATVHRGRAIDPDDLCVIEGIRATGLARTLADLGDHVPGRLVQRAVDDALRRGTSTLWLRRTAERLLRPGVRGPTVLLLLLDEHERDRRVPESWFERLLGAALTQPDLPPMVRQHVIRRADGAFVARVDLAMPAMPAIRLGIEAHSRQFHFGAGARRRDEDRDLRVAAEGWQLLYLGWQDAMQPADALALVRRIVAARSAA